VRILQVHTRYRQPGGEDVVADAEAAMLRQAGHDVVAYDARNPNGAFAAAASLVLSPWNPAAARALREAVRRLRPDVAHVHNTWYALSPSVVAELHDAGVPVVMTLHNYRLLCANGMLFRDGRPCEDCVGSHPWHGVRHGCYRASMALSVPAAATIALHRQLGTWQRRVGVFVAMTQFARERFVAGGLPAERIIVKPHFVADLGLRSTPPSASKQLLYVGRLSAEKGVGVLVEAFSRLTDRNGLQLVIVGDGPERAALERRAGPGVRFVGRLSREETLRRMHGARALAFPSIWYEGQPMAVLEAMAAGLPVVASDIGGVAEILERGAGWLCPSGDAAAWATTLRRLADPAAVDATGLAARARWRERHTPEAGLSRLEAAYERAMRVDEEVMSSRPR
jgi:glycosyltransferase involved in cell wall biosynthesis